MPNVKYPDSVPVDEPVARPKMARKPMMPMGRPKPRPVQYPDSVPVDEPVAAPKPFKKGGSIDGIAKRGKTKGRMI